MSEYIIIGTIIAAFAVAAVLSYFFTPPVKNFAHKVGAIDVPKDARRMHKKPIPRLGGLAIYGGFLCSILIFGQLDETMLCVLLGAAIIRCCFPDEKMKFSNTNKTCGISIRRPFGNR